MQDGFLIVDKPPGVTSHDVVAVVRAVTGLKKVGHTGTLDPFATGVLPLALGAATRLIQFLDEREKVYDATLRLGSATDTGDPTGTVVAEAPVPALARARVQEVLATFVGPRQQVPPRYSAVKVAGRPLYDYARRGEDVAIAARPIEVFGMELLDVGTATLRVRIRCSRGTYARVLAEEIGEALGTVAHLEALRRDASGAFTLAQSIGMARIADIVAGDVAWERVLRPSRDGEARVPWRGRDQVRDGLAPWVIGARDALRHLPAVTVAPLDARRLRAHGAPPPLPAGVQGPCLLLEGDAILAVAHGTSLVPLLHEDGPPDRRGPPRGGRRRNG
jgi:tRNA pseudouridine55 synthase